MIFGLADLLLILPIWFHALILCITRQNPDYTSPISQFLCALHKVDFYSTMSFDSILGLIVLLKSESGFLLSGV